MVFTAINFSKCSVFALLKPGIVLSQMSGQAKISAFFTQSTKRTINNVNNGEIGETMPKTPSPKKLRMDEKGDEISSIKENIEKSPNSNVPSVPLSPEQKDRIEQNKLAARARLASKTSNGLLVDVGPSWFRALESEFSKEYFTNLSKFVMSERSKHTIYPPVHDVFSWTNYCSIDKVKVVILGQDPYHGPKQAHGLCFSVQKGVPPPPSLQNMYKALTEDIPGFSHPGHGTLIGWANQGVLLLNACLTVRAGQANSHKDQGWEKFTDAVISYLNKNKRGLVFMLWGSYAQKKGAHIDKKKHHVLTGVHPSPLSAHRGFFSCKHFSKCNELLKKEGKSAIDWNHLPPQS
ncbi:uracil-DNA glycosylase-like [Saccostrea echinata]|uniref:uracil-DNA glycosylase-like n=1 Tax=Saccostrea echinata TaxID=191078 RepID=UPI002A7F99D6|nr:uracil-DNA glycosylase-like [Saccostrea echinata]